MCRGNCHGSLLPRVKPNLLGPAFPSCSHSQTAHLHFYQSPYLRAGCPAVRLMSSPLTVPLLAFMTLLHPLLSCLENVFASYPHMLLLSFCNASLRLQRILNSPVLVSHRQPLLCSWALYNLSLDTQLFIRPWAFSQGLVFILFVNDTKLTTMLGCKKCPTNKLYRTCEYGCGLGT